MSGKRVVLVTLMALLMGVSAAPASAATAGPGFTLDPDATPTNFFSSASEDAECRGNLSAEHPPCDAYRVYATNAGSEPTNGSTVTLLDTLPTGPKGEQLVTVQRIELSLETTQNVIYGSQPGGSSEAEPGDCTTVPVRCTFSKVLAPGDMLRMYVYVTVNEGAAGPPIGPLRNAVTVSGGGAPTVSAASENEVSPTPVSFGIASFDFYKDALNGSQETQAGGHPYELTTTIDLDTELREDVGGGTGKLQGFPASVEKPKDVVVDLPLGFAGSTLAAPECTEAQLDSESYCPPDTVVGHITTEPASGTSGADKINGPIWNLVPEHGHPAEFGYIDSLKGTHIAGYVSVVPTPAGYVLQFVANDIPELTLSQIVVTFYGDPAEEQAETRQQQTEIEVGHPVAREIPGVQVPFFTNPTACSNGPQVAKIWIDSWHNPARFDPGTLIPTDLEESAWKKAESVSPPVTGCDALQFTPELGVQPTTHEADKPSGLEFETKLAQSEIFGTNATPALKDLTVDFPAGMTVDPSSADGLGVCTNAQIGYEGSTLFDFSQAPPECPESSKIGSLELETPLLPGKLNGEVFLASQNENPFHSTFAIYVVVDDPVTGVVFKVAGELKANPQTGQLTSVFDENPQLPFSVLKVHFFGGPRAELATPPNCGLYTTNSVMEPWSAPDSGPSGTPFSNYLIDENCATGFNPAFAGGSTNLQAGQYSPFVGSFERQDNDQELGGLTMNLPPGMLADVASVPLCPEEQANAGTCPESAQVGTVEAGAGPGPNPLFVPGKIYLTGPYNGGPYGLSVVVPADPGPFNFGLVVVRQSLRINPFTAAVTAVSNPFPTILDPTAPNGQTTGIPIKLRRVDFDINRPGFTFNPSNCSKLAVSGAITSTQGAASNQVVPFQVTNCATLKFAPKFVVSTTAKNSKAYGTSLTTKLSYPSAPQGTYADIARVKVELPKQLPSRLTTLQKACTLVQFDTNPANCPSESKIGYATVHTPILAGALSGPAIFVSHGGEAFPTLTMVLQGDGVTIEIVGTTYISKAGVTSTTFKTVPDSPFSTFELTLPEGKFSALTALGNLCTQKLTMPSEFVAQNGAESHVDTPVSVSGCAKAKVLTRAQKLAKALESCRKDKKKDKREACEKAARKKYGPVKKSKPSKKKKKG
jgi:hypothetical protein